MRWFRRRHDTFAALVGREREGLDFSRVVLARPGTTAVVAPHGGGIEAGTSEISRALAGARRTLYLFEGIRPRANQDLHVPSTSFDDPLLLDLLAKSRIVVTVHGCAGAEPAVYLGGLDDRGKRTIEEELRAGGFHAAPDRSGRDGSDPANICNRGSSGRGVQLEITRGLRRQLFLGLDRAGREAATVSFTRLVAAVDRALRRMEEDEGADIARMDPEPPPTSRNA
ncbi:MAG: poly-gamma-glutamate hydrolase family protein [Candidatus Eisenbacteria bacterium]